MTSTVTVQRAVMASDLPAPARLIVHTLCARADFGTGVVPDAHTPSLTDLVNETGLSRSSVKKFLNGLEIAGWVKRDRPDAVAARTEYARTGYRLTVGGSIPVDADPRPPRDLGRHTAQGSRPPHDPPLGRETTTPRPPHGPSKEGTYGPSSTLPSTSQKTSSSTTKRGTRIPDDFTVTPDMVTWARTECPDVDGRYETAQFVAYWRAKPGAGATKLDWPLTWQVWMRKAQRDAGRRPPPRTTGANRHLDHLTPEQRAARNPFAGAVRASQVAAGDTR